MANAKIEFLLLIDQGFIMTQWGIFAAEYNACSPGLEMTYEDLGVIEDGYHSVVVTIPALYPAHPRMTSLTNAFCIGYQWGEWVANLHEND